MSRIQARLSRFLPLESLFNYFDLKLGSEILTYFALFNKVAGFYGLLAIFFGGNALFLDQLLLYLYNIASIGGIVWGLRGIWDVSGIVRGEERRREGRGSLSERREARRRHAPSCS